MSSFGRTNREKLPTSVTSVVAVIFATPRSACNASMTAFICAGACSTALSIASSSRYAIPRALHLRPIIQQRRLLGAVLEAHATQPPSIFFRPRLRPLRWPSPVAKQKFAQPMLGPQLVLLRRLSGAHHVSERLVRGVRHPYCRQIPAPIAARQLLCVSAVRLDPIACLHRHQRWCHHLAFHTQPRQLPVQRVPRRTCLVAHPHRGNRL